MHVVLSSRCSPRTRPNLVHLHIEHRPSPLVAANTSERQGPAAAVLSYGDDAAICKVSRERASALGTADSLLGTAMVFEPWILVSKTLTIARGNWIRDHDIDSPEGSEC